MNPSDSKLEEIDTNELIRYLVTHETTLTIDRLISKVKEQDREIARLTFQVKGLSVERTSAKQRAEKVENLLAEKEKV